MEQNKSNIIEQVNSLLNDIQKKSTERESIEWYLSNNLNDFLQVLKVANSGNEIKIATQILMRFCAESMNWDTELFKRCSNITESARRLAKNYDQQS